MQYDYHGRCLTKVFSMRQLVCREILPAPSAAYDMRGHAGARSYVEARTRLVSNEDHLMYMSKEVMC